MTTTNDFVPSHVITLTDRDGGRRSAPLVPWTVPRKSKRGARCRECGLPADAPIHTGGHPTRCHPFAPRVRAYLRPTQ